MKWILCNEKMPKINEHHISEDVLVTVENIETSERYVGIDHAEENVFGDCCFACERPTPYGDSPFEVKAWMPLPKAFEEETE